MSRKEDATGDLIERLASGWSPSHSGLAQEFVQGWKDKFKADCEIKLISDNALYFVADLSDIRFRGMDRVSCLLLGGDGSGIDYAAQEFWKRVREPGRIPFVLAMSESAYTQAQQALPYARCVVLHAQQVKELMEATDPRQFLKRCIRQQIPKRRLIPYTILLPAAGAMFFGRRSEMGRLREQDDVSFAIAGPSRVGKTSLVRQYIREMVRDNDPRTPCRFYIDFYDCGDKSADSVARFFATKIEPSSRSERVTAKDLVNFLRYQRHRLGNSLDLLLDEVDEVCQSQAFKFLGAAAREGYCRLVLCGRGALLKTVLSQESPLGCRLELLRLEPLDDKSARKLLLEPLTDLGFSIGGPDHLVEHVFRLTGRLPHLLQFYGGRLANLAVEEEVDTISVTHIETLKWDYETAQYFTSPLHDLADAETRFVALSLLKDECSQPLTIAFVRDLAIRGGINLSHARTVEICNDLFINNVLAWSKGIFRIANEALPYYAREIGYLDGALEEARRAVKMRS